MDGQGLCEALYVGVLTVNSGAVLNTSAGCKLYYRTLVNAGSIPGLGVEVVQFCTTDLNEDCMHDALDLAMLLGQWGACVECHFCSADLDGNCQVDAADLAVLLGNWGPCSSRPGAPPSRS